MGGRRRPGRETQAREGVSHLQFCLSGFRGGGGSQQMSRWGSRAEWAFEISDYHRATLSSISPTTGTAVLPGGLLPHCLRIWGGGIHIGEHFHCLSSKQQPSQERAIKKAQLAHRLLDKWPSRPPVSCWWSPSG